MLDHIQWPFLQIESSDSFIPGRTMYRITDERPLISAHFVVGPFCNTVGEAFKAWLDCNAVPGWLHDLNERARGNSERRAASIRT